jgi:putative lipoprotein
MIFPYVLAVSLALPGDSWFGVDKVKHFIVAAVVQGISYSVLRQHGVRHDQALVGATFVTGVASVGKEWVDRRRMGLFSTRDLVWDAAGAATATILLHQSKP